MAMSKFILSVNYCSADSVANFLNRKVLKQDLKQGSRNSSKAGGAVKELRAIETWKKQKERYQLCLFLQSNNVDLKKNSRNYRKPFWIWWVL